MPIFEFDCITCGKTFEKLVRNSNLPLAQIACPSCGDTHVLKKLSTFAAKASGGSASASSSSDCSTGGT
jgi:putative FmdB family regulatory protein